MNKQVVIKDKTYLLKYKDFDEDVELDDLLKIDYSNLIGEMITFPIIMNRFGLMLADAEAAVSEAKLNLKVAEAKARERYRIELEEEKGKKPSVDEVSVAVQQDNTYIALTRVLIKKEKTRDYVQSVYWASKDKSDKLDKLSLQVQPGDVDESLIAGKVNNIEIRKRKNLID